MKRVVITGLGIVSSIGNNVNEVLKSLQLEKSGISFNKEQADLGFRSHVCGDISADIKKLVPRKDLRFMGDGAAYSHISMAEAINDSKLSQDEISNNRTGLIVGSGASSGLPIVEMSDVLRSKGARRVNPFFVPKIMSSCNSANLATAFKIKGFNYSISSACATSSHCLGNAFHTIQNGLQDRMFVGGGDEITYIITLPFDAMGALSANFNDIPEKASRPYDKDRDGFVVSGGGGTIILEEYEIAKNRGAKIYCEVTGYGLSSDGFDMVRPSGEGAEFCMKMATKDLKEPISEVNNFELVKNLHIEYINSGSLIITTNSYSCTPQRLKRFNLENEFKNLQKLALRAAKEAITETGLNNNVKIAGCFSPLPGSYFKDKSISKKEMIETYLSIGELQRDDVDFFIITFDI